MIYFSNPKQSLEKYKKLIEKNIVSVVKSGQYIKSNELNKFETSFSKYLNTKHVVGTGNATDAIYIALKALNIGKGDEVITPSHTATGTGIAILNTGATPVFADISEKNFNIDPNLVTRKITKRTKAIIAVHIYGQSCNMEYLYDVAKKFGIPIIEDCSQSSGSVHNKKKLGSIGLFGCFSFFPTKNLSCIGDGGAISTKDKYFYNKCKSLGEYGWNRSRDAINLGINSRLDELQAAILNVKLKFLDKDNKSRRLIAKYYDKNINNKLIIKPLETESNYHVYYLYVLRIKNREKFINYLKKTKIFPGIHYRLPLHKQKIFRKYKSYLPITERICKEIVSIPMYPGLDKKNQKKIARLINKF